MKLATYAAFWEKWRAPDPQLAMVVALANEELPSAVVLANPSGAEGAVEGMAGPADEKTVAGKQLEKVPS